MDRPCLTYGQQDLNNSIDMRTEGKLRVGRPKTTWRRVVERDILGMNSWERADSSQRQRHTRDE